MDTARHSTRISILRSRVALPLGGSKIILGASWLVFVPAGLWALVTFGVSILGAFLPALGTWVVALLVGALILLALLAHAGAHLVAARLTRSPEPPAIPLYPLGDAAQVWPEAVSPAYEAAGALAGPLANALLAGVAYLLWNAQLYPYLNVAMPVWGVFNAILVVANLAPVFPLDGGRLMRAVTWGWLGRPAWGTNLAVRLGYIAGVALVAWGIFLGRSGGPFGIQTAAATFAAAALILLPLRMYASKQLEGRAAGHEPGGFAAWFRRVAVATLCLVLLAISASLVPVNLGLEAPGVALPVEPMVKVPADHLYPPAGSLILTSVIQQVPITLGAWVAGKVSPAVQLVRPEEIVPPNTTLQEQARRGFEMLDESSMLASAVGLRLAGYQVTAQGKGAEVLGIVDGSPSQGVLQQGDVIVSADGAPVQTTTALIKKIAAAQPGSRVRLQVRRAGRDFTVEVPLMAPAHVGDPPRLGIMVGSAGLDIHLPFPVKIVPQKIVGGPSAGLMFTLAVYDAVTPGDLTGGHKIAGTGTIDIDGAVGPIGGVAQKVVAAESAGAEYFLSPPENYAAARSAARRIKVVEVGTAQQAIDFLHSLPPVATR